MHLKRHNNEKKYECKHCRERFVEAWQLKEHRLTHEKKSNDQRCGKAKTPKAQEPETVQNMGNVRKKILK